MRILFDVYPLLNSHYTIFVGYILKYYYILILHFVWDNPTYLANDK